MGRVLLGRAKKAGDLVQHFGAVDFVLVLQRQEWSRLNDKQRKALIDHELCHCVEVRAKDGLRWGLRGHDLEEFTVIVERHGLWLKDLEWFVRRATPQLSLLEDTELEERGPGELEAPAESLVPPGPVSPEGAESEEGEG